MFQSCTNKDIYRQGCVESTYQVLWCKANTDFDILSGDFGVECWVKLLLIKVPGNQIPLHPVNWPGKKKDENPKKTETSSPRKTSCSCLKGN